MAGTAQKGEERWERMMQVLERVEMRLESLESGQQTAADTSKRAEEEREILARQVDETAEDKHVISRPATFALVHADGTTTFLGKALKFIKVYGKSFFHILIIQYMFVEIMVVVFSRDVW